MLTLMNFPRKFRQTGLLGGELIRLEDSPLTFFGGHYVWKAESGCFFGLTVHGLEWFNLVKKNILMAHIIISIQTELKLLKHKHFINENIIMLGNK